MEMRIESKKPLEWFWDLTTAVNSALSMMEIYRNRIEGKVNDLSYYVDLIKGTVSSPEKKLF